MFKDPVNNSKNCYNISLKMTCLKLLMLEGEFYWIPANSYFPGWVDVWLGDGFSTEWKPIDLQLQLPVETEFGNS